MKKTTIMFMVVAFMIAGVNTAYAIQTFDGHVYCDVNQNAIIDSEDEPLPGVTVMAQHIIYYYDATTDADGYYTMVTTWDPYTLSLDLETLPSDAVLIDPSINGVSFPSGPSSQDWLIDSEACREQVGACWLTAGGVKFDPVTGLNVAQHENTSGRGPKDSVGGVVFPSCSPEPGVGGNWNHIFHKAQWHLKGTDLTVVECGNVTGIDPGTESPVCPYNFIEFVGTGTLVGIGGNKDEYAVDFFVRAEDRNEPGNEQSNPGGGAYIDRYFLQVFNQDGGGLLLEVSDANEDPITITGGNFQIHCSSCDD
jgi:hypothetical protein